MKNSKISPEQKKKIRIYKLVLMLCGIAAALPFNIKYLGILGWVAIAPFIFVFIKAENDGFLTLRRGYSFAFSLFFPFYLTVYFWILYMYPMEYAGITPLFSAVILLFGWCAMSVIFAAIFSLIGPLFLLLKRKTILGKYPVLLATVFPVLWIIFEWAQTLTWFGVPFAWLAVSQQYMLPLVQSASLLGTLFVDLIMVAVNSFIALAAYYPQKRRLLSGVSAGIFVINLAFGAVSLLSYSQDSENSVKAAAIQGNISSIDERDTMTYSEIQDLYIGLCVSAAQEGAELIVIPESALPAFFDLNRSKLDIFIDFSTEYGVTVLLGGYYQKINDDGTKSSANAIYCINPDGTVGEQPYIKRMLVPFGEYVPMRPVIETVLPMLTEINMLSEDGGRGDDSELHDTVYGKIGSLICYDSVYNSLARDSTTDGAELIAVSTDDSWFESSPELYEHLGHSVLRAIENGRYVVRAANTGVSAIISPVGEIKEQLLPDETGYVLSDVEFKDSTTLFSLVGNIIILFCGVYIFTFVMIAIIKITGRRLRSRDFHTYSTEKNTDN